MDIQTESSIFRKQAALGLATNKLENFSAMCLKSIFTH